MNAAWLITVGTMKGAKIEGFSAERTRPDRNPGRGGVHHELVCAYDVCPLCSMRHSDCATARRVPRLSGKYLISCLGPEAPRRVGKLLCVSALCRRSSQTT